LVTVDRSMLIWWLCGSRTGNKLDSYSREMISMTDEVMPIGNAHLCLALFLTAKLHGAFHYDISPLRQQRNQLKPQNTNSPYSAFAPKRTRIPNRPVSTV
jgi:hypothetical protein